MSIAEGLAANRAAYRNYFREENPGEVFLPPAPALLEEEAFVFPTVTAGEPKPAYFLETEQAAAPALHQEEAPAPLDDDVLLDRLVYRLNRESRLRSQPLMEE